MANNDKSRDKTNVMRLLDQAGIAYTQLYYDPDRTAGEEIAALMGEDPSCVFKTLVTADGKGGHYVFVIPVTGSLDLKKAARAAGVKSIAMIKQKELLPLTGYVHGGCSPVGMAKQFPTFFAEEVILVDTMVCSAGKVGHMIEVKPDDLMGLVSGKISDLIVR